EAGQSADLLDDLDLLVADAFQDDVELALLLGFAAFVTAGGAATGHGHGRRSSSGHVEGLLELRDELGQLDEGHFLENVDELVIAELRHSGRSFLDWSCSRVRCARCSGGAGSGPRPGGWCRAPIR